MSSQPTSTAAGAVVGSGAINAGKERSPLPEGAPAPTGITCRRCFRRPRTASTIDSSSVCTTAATASESSSWYSTSRSRYEGFMGLTTPPMRAMA